MHETRHLCFYCLLSAWVRAPDVNDWKELKHLMEYLRSSCKLPLILSADNSGLLKWYMDASFAVHPNMQGNIGGGLTLGCGILLSV